MTQFLRPPFIKFFLFVCCLSSYSYSQTGSVDTSFNSVDVIPGLSGFNGVVKESFLFPDGSYLSVGAFTSYHGESANRILKMNHDLEINPSFNTGTGSNGEINGMQVLSSNKILIFGDFNEFNGFPVDSIALINPDGSLDPSFAFDNPFWIINDVTEQSTGEIIITGYDHNYSSTIVRCSTNGTIDPTFIPASQNGIIDFVRTDNDDNLYMVGSFTQVNGIAIAKLAKLTADGTLIDSYVPPTAFTFTVEDLFIHDDGRVVICGNYGSGSSIHGYTRLLPDGSIDPGFTGAIGYTNYRQIEIDTEGRYIFVATNNMFDFTRRVLPTGVVDVTYEIVGMASGSYHLLLEPDGKAFVSGLSGINRRNSNGTFDGSLVPYNGFDRSVTVVKTLPNGKLLVGGNFSAFNGKSVNGIVRLLADGTIDPSFEVGTATPFPNALNTTDYEDPNVYDIEIQTDGKILVGGYFQRFNGYPYKHLVRLNPNGSVDTSFHNSGFNNLVAEITLQPDGKILVGGEFESPAYRIVRLHPDGTEDSSFAASISWGRVRTIDLHPNGKIYIGGTFLGVNGNVAEHIACVLMDGTLDNSFSVGTALGAAPLQDIAIQSDGKLIVLKNGVFRISESGALDNTFIVGGVFTSSNFYQKVAIQPDGKILIIGSYQAAPSPDPRLGRLNPDGTLDNSFEFSQVNYSTPNQVGYGPLSFALQQDGNIILGGSFAIYNSVPRHHITRLHNDLTNNDCQFFSASFEVFNDLNCANTTTIEAQALNGTAPYSYSWDNSIVNEDDTLFSTSEGGIHYMSVIDSAGCAYHTGFMINGPTTQMGFDNRISIVSGGYRPGLNTIVTLDASNQGCIPVDGSVVLVKNPLLTFISSDPVPTDINGDTLIWDYDAFAHDSTHFIVNDLVFSTSTAAQIGDVIRMDARIYPIEGDHDTLNNIHQPEFAILNSYDPNDKQVYPKGECVPGYVDHGQDLTYTVRFQNTGNAEAIHVLIVDSLSEHLDIHSLQILGSSHDVHAEIASNDVVKFRFNNINLPDSASSPEGSIGYVIFKVSQKPFLFIGSEIRNKVGIYFDFNPPIITNEVLNTISSNYTQEYAVINNGEDTLAVCFGTPVTLVATGANSFEWYDAGINGNLLGVSDSLALEPEISQWIYVEPISNECPLQDRQGVFVKVEVTPEVEIETIQLAICIGDSIHLSYNGTADNYISNYMDAFTSGLPFEVNTAIWLEGMNSNNCVARDSVLITVNPLPDVSFNVEADTACMETQVPFTIAPSNGIFTGEGISGGFFGPVTSPGNYVITYTVTDADNCINSTSDTIIVIECSELSTWEGNNDDINVFYASKEAAIIIKGMEVEYYELIGMDGKLVANGNIADNIIDVSMLSDAAYFVKLLSSQREVVYRVVKNSIH